MEIQSDRVRELAEKIKAEAWPLGESADFIGADGYVQDGQHRLGAIIERDAYPADCTADDPPCAECRDGHA